MKPKVTSMNLQIRSFETADEPSVVQLWKDAGLTVPWNDPHRDIQRKLAVQSDLLLVGSIDGKIVASVMAGYDGHRGWVYYLAVQPDLQRGGIGRQMMEEAEARLKSLGCPKIDLMVRSSNTQVIEFYKSIGYKIVDFVTMGKRLEPDD